MLIRDFNKGDLWGWIWNQVSKKCLHTHIYSDSAKELNESYSKVTSYIKR